MTFIRINTQQDVPQSILMVKANGDPQPIDTFEPVWLPLKSSYSSGGFHSYAYTYQDTYQLYSEVEDLYAVMWYKLHLMADVYKKQLPQQMGNEINQEFIENPVDHKTTLGTIMTDIRRVCTVGGRTNTALYPNWKGSPDPWGSNPQAHLEYSYRMLRALSDDIIKSYWFEQTNIHKGRPSDLVPVWRGEVVQDGAIIRTALEPLVEKFNQRNQEVYAKHVVWLAQNNLLGWEELDQFFSTHEYANQPYNTWSR